jgi:ABC-type enterobactin transport system permease subunit
MIGIILGSILGLITSVLLFDVPLAIPLAVCFGQVSTVGLLYVLGYKRT